jgi:hypothetical protein
MNDAMIGAYIDAIKAIGGVLGCYVFEIDSARSLGGFGVEQVEGVEDRLRAGVDVLRSQRDAVRLLGLGRDVEDVMISQSIECHVLRMIQSAPGLCCAVALSREGSSLGLARLMLVEAEELFTQG